MGKGRILSEKIEVGCGYKIRGFGSSESSREFRQRKKA